MNEAELKLAYIRLFKEDILKEWKELCSQINFGDITDEEIASRMQEMRYNKS